MRSLKHRAQPTPPKRRVKKIIQKVYRFNVFYFTLGPNLLKNIVAATLTYAVFVIFDLYGIEHLTIENNKIQQKMCQSRSIIGKNKSNKLRHNLFLLLRLFSARSEAKTTACHLKNF